MKLRHVAVLATLLLSLTGCSVKPSLSARTMPTLPASTEKAIDGPDFSIVPAPGWTPGTPNAVTKFILMAPKQSGDFHNNLNVLTQEDPGSLAKYREITLQGMSQIKATVLEEQSTTVDGIESYRCVFKANMGGKDLKFCSTAVPKNKKIYLVTGTALESEYTAMEPQFDQMTYSLKIK